MTSSTEMPSMDTCRMPGLQRLQHKVPEGGTTLLQAEAECSDEASGDTDVLQQQVKEVKDGRGPD